MLKKCFGIISWFPDNEPNRSQRIERLNKAFKQLQDVFGEDIEFLIVAQNWKNYRLPKSVKKVTLFKYDKLGILNARKALRKHFLQSDYDYIIMCDDDIVLNSTSPNAGKNYLKKLDAHPEGFMFVQYGWSLNLCAISRWIYEKEDMCDVDPEKNEGYEDMVFPLLLHYKYPKKEFKIEGIKFLQHQATYHKDCKSTWENGRVNHQELKQKTDMYVEEFKKGNFDIASIKPFVEEKWQNRPKSELDIYIENYINTLNETTTYVNKSKNLKESQETDAALPSLSDFI